MVTMTSCTSQALFDKRYRLIAEVAKGGFSRVLRAQDALENNRIVAIKEMTPSVLSPQLLDIAKSSYQREAMVLQRLQHHRMPRLHGYSFNRGIWYLVLEYVAGETLESCLTRLRKQQRELPLRKVLNIGIQLCDVLDYLHQQLPPIKYRDLKPENIMLQPNGELMLIDFGLAAPYYEGELDTFALGSEGYAAPEQYPQNEWGEGGMSTPYSDLYSLGVILHQLVSGENPRRKPRALRHVFSPLNNKVPSALANLVAHMLQPQPEQRTQSIQEVLLVLQSVQTLHSEEQVSTFVAEGISGQ